MKIAIFSISEFSGHRYAANAIEDEVRLQFPDADIKNLNFFHYLPKKFVQTVDDTYYSMLDKKPGMWTYLRESKCLALLMKPFQILFYKISTRRVKRELFTKWQPDYVICTQSYPCNVMAQLKKPYGFRLGAVVTDYHMNAYWVNKGVDDYFVASSDMATDLHDMGIIASRIHATGIPIRPEFSKMSDSKKMLKELGLKSDRLTILVMGGSLGMGDLLVLVGEIAKQENNWQLIIVCGSNKDLFKQMQDAYHQFDFICIIGLTDKVSMLMDSSHVLVSKPGGVTVAEALAKALPLISINPLAGQEIRNEAYLIDHGVACKASSYNDVIDLLKQNEVSWLANERIISGIGFPYAAKNLVEIIS